MKIYDIEKLMIVMMTGDREMCDMDDMSLYYKVVSEMNPLVKSMRFDTVMQNRRGLGIPPISTVSRAKRKIQASHPDLRPSNRTLIARSEKEREFVEYAKV